MDELAAMRKNCPNCGATLPAVADAFCLECRMPLHEPAEKQPKEPFSDLIQGRIDAVLVDLPVADYYVRQHPNTRNGTCGTPTRKGCKTSRT